VIEAFVNATNSILAVLGEDAVLRGEIVTPRRRVNLAHNVEMYDREGNLMYEQHVGTFNKADSPLKGDTLVFIDTDGNPIAGESYILDALVEDNGYSARYVLRKTP
jgi:hypothetical protein